MVGAAVRKPRVPNDKLHRVTDNRLAEVDCKVLHRVCQWSKLARYGGLLVLRVLKGERGNFKLDANVDGQPVKFLQNGGTRISILFACKSAINSALKWQ